MGFVKLDLTENETFLYLDASGIEMNILGNFFSDIGHSRNGFSFYKNWAFDDSLGMGFGTNSTFIDKEGDYIFLVDIIPGDPDEPEDETELKITRKQFFQLIDDWQKKVWKVKPKEVTIKYENDEFTIEIKE